jgi:hypothetical protein
VKGFRFGRVAEKYLKAEQGEQEQIRSNLMARQKTPSSQ